MRPMKPLEWIGVEKAKVKCAICKKPDWCSFAVLEDGTIMSACLRVPSDRPAKSGYGWLHKGQGKAPAYIPPPKPAKPAPDFGALMARWTMETGVDAVSAHAKALGVTFESLSLLDCAYAKEHAAWAFPMRTGYGVVCGVRLRNVQGDKWAVNGSKSGLFIPSCPSQSRLFICEGPTDTAAALTLGLYAIGRPSCRGQESMVRDAITRLGATEVVIVADKDEPGQHGAELLQAGLQVPSVIWTPIAKDLRASVKLGLTAVQVGYVMRDLEWSKPKGRQ
jgi:hypothetical protein